jgi:phosphoglycerol transferase MdoB-like AlkP superfamily enzyme
VKRLDILALTAVILMVLSRAASSFCHPLAAMLFGERAVNISMLQSISALTMIPFTVLIDIAIGVWLFKESKKENRPPWVWFLFGCTFHLTAVAVFYLIRIHEQLQNRASTQKV